LGNKAVELRDVRKKVEQKFTQMVVDFNIKKDILDIADRQEIEITIAKERDKMKSMVKTCNEEIRLAMQREIGELSKKVKKAVRSIAKRENYDIVQDVYIGRTIYVSEKATITQQLIEEMDRNYNAEIVLIN